MMQMSKEYATALFMLASEENCRVEVSESLAVVVETLQDNPGYVELLSSPAVPVGERLSLIDDAFSSLHTHVVSFLKLLCEKMMMRSFLDAAEEYQNLLAASQNVSTALVTSAVSLTQEETEALLAKLTSMCGHEVEIETTIDESLLGGMIIEIDGKVIDASIRRRLGDVKDVISR